MEDKELLSENLEKLRKVAHYPPPPENYFPNMQEEVMAGIRLERTIGKVRKEEIPDGYFENLSQQVLEKAADSSPSHKIFILHSLRWVASAAALVTVLTVMWKYVLPSEIHSPVKHDYVALSNEFGNDLTAEELDQLMLNFNTEEDLWLLKQLEQVHTGELPVIETADQEEQLLQGILTDEELEYLNEIM